MNLQEKKAALEHFISVCEEFDYVLSLPDELIVYRPQNDYWSILEQIVHCMDVDIANFSRYRAGIANPGSDIFLLDQSWVKSLNYQKSNLADVIQIIKLTRKFVFQHLSSIIDVNWKEYFFTNPKSGKIDLEEFILSSSKHVLLHKELIERNINEWNKK